MNIDPLEVVENVTLQLVCQVLDANPTVNAFSWHKGSSTTPIGLLSNFSISKGIKTYSGEFRCKGSNGIGQNVVYFNVLCEYQSYDNIMYDSYVDILLLHMQCSFYFTLLYSRFSNSKHNEHAPS